jgi:hypothetical protein
MKKKLVLSAMLVCLLALGLTLIGCPTDGGGGGGGGGGNSWPTEILGQWIGGNGDYTTVLFINSPSRIQFQTNDGDNYYVDSITGTLTATTGTVNCHEGSKTYTVTYTVTSGTMNISFDYTGNASLSDLSITGLTKQP